jgi:tyrosinase
MSKGGTMALDQRKSAAALTAPERDAFLEALIRLKHKLASGGVAASVYDQFVALHQAVMSVTLAGVPESTNMGHWSIGFCPWHREYIRRLELELQREVPGVTLPYWDWANHSAAVASLFSDAFLGPLMPGPDPAPLTTSVLAFDPPTPRPPWWPATALGWRIHADLQELQYPVGTPNRDRLNATLHRGRSAQTGWPPSQTSLANLIIQHVNQPPYHHLWFFWRALEAGNRTHNSGHNFIGGHMGGALSPNDPIFWLHHANVDRLWALWQANQIQAHGGSHADHYPPNNGRSPFDNDFAPPGHRLDDIMWPWVGNTPGYGTNAPTPIRNLLQDFSGEPARRVRDVLDCKDMGALGGYEYV